MSYPSNRYFQFMHQHKRLHVSARFCTGSDKRHLRFVTASSTSSADSTWIAFVSTFRISMARKLDIISHSPLNMVTAS